MKFFNLDLHISVISDIKYIFEKLGHQVDNWSISGHAHIMGWPQKDLEHINQNTWRDINENLIEKFYDSHKQELEKYDGFIVTHTPCFSLLYEKFNKPIITIASTRYEDPFSKDRSRWHGFNSYLKKKIDSGMIIPVANNKYDKKYTELFTNRQWEHIPSLCEYTNSKYTGHKKQFIYSSKLRINTSFLENLLEKNLALGQNYKWQDLADYSGIVNIPYNASTMSLFEQYTSNIPLFFPSHKFLSQLRETFFRNGVLSELSWNQIHGLESKSYIVDDKNDPNNFLDNQIMMEWAKLSDYYDQENMPYIQYFNSFDHLKKILKDTNLDIVSQKMKKHNNFRKEMVYDRWKTILKKL